MQIAETIAAEVGGWPGVSAHPHRFGGTEFQLDGHELGHLHGNRQADLPFPVRVRKELVAAGKAELHHILPDTGWVTFYIRSADDVRAVVELFRLNYERLRASARPASGDGVAEARRTTHNAAPSHSTTSEPEEAMLQPAPPVSVLDRFAPLHEALLGALDTLSAEQWQRPTTCAGWSVHDVALHLLGGDVGILSRGRDGYAGTSKQIADWDELVAFINDRNADWVAATRRLSPRVVCDLLRLLGPEVTVHFHTLDLQALGGPVSWAGSGPAPVWLDVAREYTERWHHQQHIREAVGAPMLTEPFYLAPALATFVHALPVAYHEVEAPEGISVVLTIAGDAGQSWCLQREAQGWRLAIGQPEHVASAVTVPEDIAWRLFTHGMRASDALPHATIAGDAALGRHVLDALAIIA